MSDGEAADEAILSLSDLYNTLFISNRYKNFSKIILFVEKY